MGVDGRRQRGGLYRSSGVIIPIGAILFIISMVVTVKVDLNAVFLICALVLNIYVKGKYFLLFVVAGMFLEKAPRNRHCVRGISKADQLLPL